MRQQDLDYFTGDDSWTDMPWYIVKPGKLVRTDMQLGSYSLELQPDGKTYRLSFDSGSSIRACPTKFQATNRAQQEAEDHHRRLLAQQQQPARMKPPKW
jgi:hypothetical protein